MVASSARIVSAYARTLRALVVLAALVLATTPAGAQDSSKSGGLCLRARPAPYCSAILLTNVGVFVVAGELGNPYYGTHLRRLRIAADWGVLLPIGRHAAAGASILVSEDVDEGLVAPALRYRHWSANERSSVEVALGASLPKTGYNSNTNSVTSTFFGLIKWNPTRVVGISVRPEWRVQNDSTNCSYATPFACTQYHHGRFALSVGIEASGVPGLIATIPMLLLAGIHALVNVE